MGRYLSIGGQQTAAVIAAAIFVTFAISASDYFLTLGNLENVARQISLDAPLVFGQTIVLIDFDVKESFGHEAGNSGKWVVHPVIKATNVTFGGNVVARFQLGTGVTLPAIGGQPITLGAFTASLTPVAGGRHWSLSLSPVRGVRWVYVQYVGGSSPGKPVFTRVR